MRLPPTTAEAGVISCLLVDHDGAAIDKAMGLNPECFSTRSYRIIFEACLSLAKDNKKIDSVVLIEKIKASGKIDEIGGEYVVNKLTATAINSFMINAYIEILMDNYKLTRLMEISFMISSEQETCENVDALTSEVEKQVSSLSDGKSRSNMKDVASAKMADQIQARLRGEKIFGIDSGIPSFDLAFGGFQPSMYYILGGRPSAGKTALADQIVLHQLMRDRGVLYIALEASIERVFAKLSCKHADQVYTKYAHGKMNAYELGDVEKSRKFLDKAPLVLYRPSDITGTEIRSAIRREKRNANIELVVIDYLQKITIPSKELERRAIGDASKQIAQACIDTGVPSLVLVQLNRESQAESRPSMNNIKDSGQIEQDADAIALLWPEVDPYEVPDNELLPIIMSIEKNKDGMRGVDQKLYFDRPKMKFKERV